MYIVCTRAMHTLNNDDARKLPPLLNSRAASSYILRLPCEPFLPTPHNPFRWHLALRCCCRRLCASSRAVRMEIYALTGLSCSCPLFRGGYKKYYGQRERLRARAFFCLHISRCLASALRIDRKILDKRKGCRRFWLPPTSCAQTRRDGAALMRRLLGTLQPQTTHKVEPLKHQQQQQQKRHRIKSIIISIITSILKTDRIEPRWDGGHRSGGHQTMA